MYRYLESLPLEALAVELFYPGRMQMTAKGYRHDKTVPYTIIAQATQGRYEVTCGDGRHADYAEGEAFLTGANVPLCILHHGDPRAGGRMRARWLHMHFTLFGALDVTSLLELPLRLSVAQAERFGPIIEEELGAAEAGDAAGTGLRRLARRHELAFQALRILCEIAPPRAGAFEFLRQGQRLLPVLAHLRSHLAEPMSVAELARLAHLSVPRFHAFFRQWLGRAPMEHVRRLRLSEASRRLAVTDEPLRVVAEQTGFCNQFHLSREFKRAFGQSPSAFRRTYDRNLV